MSRIRSPKTIGLVAAGCLLLALSGVVARWYFEKTAKQPDSPRSNGFLERARESGIDFHMSFLPREQGEHFKVNLYDHGCGVAVGDYDGDGRDDVYFVNQLGPNGLFRNKGDGTFENVTEKAGVAVGDRICVAATFADYDNDGRQDLFVTSTRGGNVLFHNNGDGTFTDVTEKAGLKHVGHAQTAVFFDYDNDGYLDLFVTYTAKWTLDLFDKSANYYPGAATLVELADSPREYNVLYHNNRDGTFTDVTETAKVAGKGWGGDVAVFDFNNDGYLDLFVTNMFGHCQLFRNNKDGTFTDVAKEFLGRTSFGAIGSKVFDLSNDGNLALLVMDMHSDMWLPPDADPSSIPPPSLKKKYPTALGMAYERMPNAKAKNELFIDKFKFRPEDVLYGNTLFKKMPDGKYEEISDQANMETWWPWGIATGDFDNDGHEDVFLPSGMGYPYAYWPNALMMNNGNDTFTDRAADLGIEPPPDGRYLEEKIGGKGAARSSRCAATADFRGDGRLDIVVNNFNDRAFYFRNNFPRKNYVAFRLTGKLCNRDAVGALVKLYSGKEVMVRQVQGAGGYLSQSSKTLHFGLGDRQSVDRVEIHWPGWPADKYETIDHPAINTLHQRTEPPK
jgi:enediyne biosynthesis protein E4